MTGRPPLEMGCFSCGSRDCKFTLALGYYDGAKVCNAEPKRRYRAVIKWRAETEFLKAGPC